MLSVIVIAYNEERYLPALLESLAKQTWREFELIVVDSHSRDRTREAARARAGCFGDFHLVEMDRPRGPARARNVGAARATRERLLFLDADSVLAPTFLERAMAALAERPADVATCFIRINEGGLVSRAGALLFNAGLWALRPVYPTAFGACLFSTRELHGALGGFDEQLALCEDCEYVKRALRRPGARFRILPLAFGTSDRRSRAEGGARILLKYLGVHAYRLLTRKELAKGRVVYEYGEYDQQPGGQEAGRIWGGSPGAR